jgi:hypothetical protein
MDGKVNKIILTAEYFHQGDIDYNDLNTDVIVQFEDGDKYSATFFSFQNLQNMIHEASYMDDKIGIGRYYKIMNMVLVKDFDQSNLRPIIDTMLAEGDFQLIFKKI